MSKTISILITIVSFPVLSLALAFRPPGDGDEFQFIKMFSSPYCSMGLLAEVDINSPCDNLGSGSDVVRGIMFDRKCQSTEPYSVDTACFAYKGASSPKRVLFFGGVFCLTDFLAAIAEVSSCDAVNQKISSENKISPEVRSVFIHNNCVQISSANFETACYRFSPPY